MAQAAVTADSQQSKSVVYSAAHIGMSFSGVEVLKDVSIACRAGEVHAIIGENGAGKSTLMKILGGYLAPKTGQLFINEQATVLKSPSAAEALGIVLVHQEILLTPDLTVAQNIFLGRELRRGPFVNDPVMNAQARALLSELSADINCGETVKNLSIANRQLVQIARALSVPHKVVIFDEPTASLTTGECEALFKVISGLKAKNCAVVYISHRLNEVKRISDIVTVLRDGKLVTQRLTAELESSEMARLMVGREIARLFPIKKMASEHRVALEVDGFSVPGFVRNVSFQVGYGEILGFAGLIGAGRTELFESIVGLRPGSGRVSRDGAEIKIANFKQAENAGIVYVTEDRKGKGLLLASDLLINLTLAATASFSRFLLMQNGVERDAYNKAVSEFDIRAQSSSMLAGQLSGGNQQKLLFAKMMLIGPKVVVFDEPTRGVDIGAKSQIYEFIVKLAAEGMAVVVISSELPELIGLCHRAIVMHAGERVGEVFADHMTEEDIVVLATGTGRKAA